MRDALLQPASKRRMRDDHDLRLHRIGATICIEIVDQAIREHFKAVSMDERCCLHVAPRPTLG